MQTQFQVRPINKQLFQIHTENSHLRLSLERVLWVKFLRWIEQQPLPCLLMACAKCLMLALLLCAVLAPAFTLGVLTASAQWNGYRLPMAIAIVALVLNAQRLWRFARRSSVKLKQSRGNQYTYHGIPLDELTSYLCTHKAFPTTAINDLALSQRKWSKIAAELEHHGVLVRGESNARVLADIDRATLAEQLRGGFPLTFDIHTKTWIKKHGSYERFLHDKERAERKDVERVGKLERKESRMRENIAKLQEESTVFQNIMALAE